MTVVVGIDVAKDKHDCFILNSEGVVCILFPELEKLVSTLHMASIYALLEEFPGAKQIANANLTHLKNLLAAAFPVCQKWAQKSSKSFSDLLLRVPL